MNETAAKASAWDSPSANASHDSSAATSASPAPPAPAQAAEAASSFSSRQHQPHPHPRSSLNHTQATSVLIVEDDRSARRAISGILKRQGFAVSEAGTVADAIANLAQRRHENQHQPDWILLDLMLPDGCGLDVLRHTRHTHPTDSKICIITGCDAELLSQARRSGAEHTFTKPLDVNRLIAVLAA